MSNHSVDTVMDEAIASVVARVHDTPEQSVLAVAGAGNYALAWLLGVGGRVAHCFGNSSALRVPCHDRFSWRVCP